MCLKFMMKSTQFKARKTKMKTLKLAKTLPCVYIIDSHYAIHVT